MMLNAAFQRGEDLDMTKELSAEFIGTFALVSAVCGSALFSAPTAGLVAVAFAVGLSVLAMAYAVGPISGGHFNPDNKQHGLKNPEGHHAGDMPNFTVDANGKANAKIDNKDVNWGSDSHSIFSNGVTALVIHAHADDMKTDPAGNAGDRIACGVITQQ